MTRGALLIGQSGGATAVTNATLMGALEAGIESSLFERVLGMKHGFEGLLRDELIELDTLSAEQRSVLRQTPGAALGTSRLKVNDEQLDQAMQVLERHNVRGVVLIGGNDSADSAMRLNARSGGQIPTNLAPKTVDNDLVETDHCPGFSSAARFLANLVRDATYDSLSAPALYPVKFIEVVGRDAGWIAAACGLGFAEHDIELQPLIYVAEHPPASAEAIVEAVMHRVEAQGFAVCVVPETLRDASGEHLAGSTPEYVDPFGHPYYPSAGQALADLLRASTALRARLERPGSGARMSISMASPVDLDEAYLAGRAAVDAIGAGQGGIMSGIERLPGSSYRSRHRSVDLALVANRVRSLPQSYFDPITHAPTEDFAAYALPLLGPNPFPPYARLDQASRGSAR